MAFFGEFKKFIMRGNVLDMAVGIIIGGAFGKIISSLVNDIIMPVVGIVLGNINVSALEYKIGTPVEGVEQASIKYGLFIQNILDFIIIAFCIFVFIKIISNLRKKEEAPAEPPKPSNEEVLLTDIKALLEKISNK